LASVYSKVKETSYSVGNGGEARAGALGVCSEEGINVGVRNDRETLVDQLEVAIVIVFTVFVLDPDKHSEWPWGTHALRESNI